MSELAGPVEPPDDGVDSGVRLRQRPRKPVGRLLPGQAGWATATEPVGMPDYDRAKSDGQLGPSRTGDQAEPGGRPGRAGRATTAEPGGRLRPSQADDYGRARLVGKLRLSQDGCPIAAEPGRTEDFVKDVPEALAYADQNLSLGPCRPGRKPSGAAGEQCPRQNGLDEPRTAGFLIIRVLICPINALFCSCLRVFSGLNGQGFFRG